MTHCNARLALIVAGAAVLGCDATGLDIPPPPNDLSIIPDLATAPEPDDLEPPPTNECGDNDPSCSCITLAPPFHLTTDVMKDPLESDANLVRDGSGNLKLTALRAPVRALWIANAQDWNRGTISRVDPKTVRETARYFTVTCLSNPTGSQKACDGTNGCCSRDDNVRFQNRVAGRPDGPHQAVLLQNDYPSRTAVESDGSVWVVNRTFGTATPSVTRIAGSLADCVDRNHNGRIDTSADLNGDGLIQTDCNADSMADDLDGVKNSPCANGRKQEFFGVDDECILFTTNFDGQFQQGRGVATMPFSPPADAWVTGSTDGQLYRVQGTTGLIKETTTLLAGCSPDGLAIDSSGIGWISSYAQTTALCYFDTKHATTVGKARNPAGGNNSFYTGLTLDRDGNIWTNGFTINSAFRYTPDRTNGTMNLANGVWTEFQNLGMQGSAGGIAVDARSPSTSFAWVGRPQGKMIRIPASNYPPAGKNRIFDGTNFLSIPIGAGFPSALGVDSDQNLWSVSSFPSSVTRILVDKAGNATTPDLTSPPMGDNHCPAGDVCALKDASIDPRSDAYSNFTTFNPITVLPLPGVYTYEFTPACVATTAYWKTLSWDADVPAGTTIAARVRSGDVPMPDGSWSAWEAPINSSPSALTAPGQYIQLEMSLSTTDPAATPLYKSARLCFECKM